jgi:predicted RNase H-like HicB family nuclease
MDVRAMPDELHITVRFEDGALWATVEEYPGVFATGDTLEELRASLEEGISLYLAGPGEEPRAVRLGGLESAEPVATSAQVALA